MATDLKDLLKTKKCWILRSSKLYITLIISFLAIITCPAQQGNKYYFPLRPGHNNYLSGTMGEIRNTHFHAGIDIRTGGASGLPVYATESGYISRIVVSASGYGNVLYIKHPNGETSVYGHLFRFRKDIADWVRSEQYKKESFEVNLFPEKERFIIEKKDLIALSGNTGSSQGPHLHFEIRDNKQRPINPLVKKYAEIKDEVPPVAEKIALTTLSIDSRINNQFGRFEFDLNRNGNEYIIREPVHVKGILGLQVFAYDKMTGTSSRNGIPYIEMYLDDHKLYEIRIDTISFSETNHVAVHYDYGVRTETNRVFQKLYLDDGNPLKLYEYDEQRGRIIIKDTLQHEVLLILKDYYNNESKIRLLLKGDYTSSIVDDSKMDFTNDPDYSIHENILSIRTYIQNAATSNSILYSNRMKYELLPSYFSEHKSVYLWDLRLGLPDSVSLCGKSKHFNFEVMIPSGSSFTFYNRNFDLTTSRHTLYDTLYLEAAVETGSETERFIIGSNKIPLKNNLRINLKPKLIYNDNERTSVYKVINGNSYEFIGGDWQGNAIRFATRSLGEFTILTDSIPPKIKPLRIKQDKISFLIEDELSGIGDFEVRVNGNWLLMNYDAKRDYIWSDPLDQNKNIAGELLLTVEDNAGNISTFKTIID